MARGTWWATVHGATKGWTDWATEHTYSTLLLLLSRFSRGQLCTTPQTAAHQAPPSLGVSRQDHWSGLPFPSPMHESESEVKSISRAQLFPTPWTAAHQAPPSMGFSRQEHWSGLLLPSPLSAHKSLLKCTKCKLFSVFSKHFLRYLHSLTFRKSSSFPFKALTALRIKFSTNDNPWRPTF